MALASRCRAPLVLYHGRCLDGHTAAWAARHVWPGAEFVPISYGIDPLAVPADGRDLYLLDYCPGSRALQELASRARSTWVLDHHKSAFEDCGDLPYTTFDMKRSGAGLAWDELVGLPRPWVVDYVEDADLHHYQLPYSAEVNAHISALPLTFDAWDELVSRDPIELIPSGKGVLSHIHKCAAEMAKEARVQPFGRHRDVPVVNVPYMLADATVGLLARDHAFAAGWFQRSDGLYQYSLRSLEVDVSQVAREFGGGGHPRTAGFVAEQRV
jgi:hypothetical protein